MYAKINNQSIVQFPYFEQHLQEENSRRIMVPIHDLCGSYSGTEEAVKTGNSVVEIVVDDRPQYDESKEFLQYDLSTLRNQNGAWRLGWKKELRTPQETVVV